MRNSSYSIVCFLFLMLVVGGITSSCSKDDVDYGYLSGEFRLDFATVLFENDSLILALDSQDTLRSSDFSSLSFTKKSGQRVIVNHSPDEGDGIVIHSVTDILTSRIYSSANLDTLSADPVKIQSIWMGGGYLNLILYFNYYSTTHKFGLYRSADSANVLVLSHDKQGDSEGYPVRVYMSFLLNGLEKSADDSTRFSVDVPTSSGTSTYQFSFL